MGKPETFPNSQGNGTALVGAIFASAGAVGWIMLLCMLLPYEASPSLENVLIFGLNFFVVVIGGVLSGMFSLMGLIFGAISAGSYANRLTWLSIGLGGGGLVAGAAILAWRFTLVTGG